MITRPYLHGGEARYGTGRDKNGAELSSNANNEMLLLSSCCCRCCCHCQSPTTTTIKGTPPHGLTVPSKESLAWKRAGTVPLLSLAASDDDISMRQARCEGYPSTRIVHPVWRRDVGGTSKHNYFWWRRGDPPLWLLSLIAMVVQAYPTPAQEQQVHIHAHQPVEHIPAAIVVIVDVAIIDPTHHPPPSYDNAATVVVLLLY
jgi:hypothetical protein